MDWELIKNIAEIAAILIGGGGVTYGVIAKKLITGLVKAIDDSDTHNKEFVKKAKLNNSAVHKILSKHLPL